MHYVLLLLVSGCQMLTTHVNNPSLHLLAGDTLWSLAVLPAAVNYLKLSQPILSQNRVI